MLPRQRHLEIQYTLERQGGVKVAELARHLRVTEETIRRDLVRMEEANLLVRTHGGAVPLEHPHSTVPHHLREIEQVEAKRSIARRALLEINEDETLFLDASTTVHQLARVFPDIHCTVITHSEPVFTELSRRSHVELISTGGVFDRPSASFVGPLAEQMITTCQISKAFLGCKGLDFKRGFSDASIRHMNLKRSVIHWAEEVYILADHTKFDIRSRFFFASLDDVHHVITNPGPPPQHRQTLRDTGVNLLLESPNRHLPHAS